MLPQRFTQRESPDVIQVNECQPGWAWGAAVGMKLLQLLFVDFESAGRCAMAAAWARRLANDLPDYLAIESRAATAAAQEDTQWAFTVMSELNIEMTQPAVRDLDLATLAWADLVVVLGEEREGRLPVKCKILHWPLPRLPVSSQAGTGGLEANRAVRDQLGLSVRNLHQALLVDYLDAVDGSVYTRADVEILTRTREHDGFVPIEAVKLRHRLYAGGWSETVRREVAVRNPAVGVLLYDPDRDEVVLVRQFRAGALDDRNGPWMLEIVAGIAGDDEEPSEVAKREALEEANCRIDDLVEICSYFNSPGWSNEEIHLYCARVDAAGVEGIHGLDDEHEDILVVTVTRERAQAMVEKGEINNAMAVIAIQWLELRHTSLKSRWQAGP